MIPDSRRLVAYIQVKDSDEIELALFVEDDEDNEQLAYSKSFGIEGQFGSHMLWQILLHFDANSIRYHLNDWSRQTERLIGVCFTPARFQTRWRIGGLAAAIWQAEASKGQVLLLAPRQLPILTPAETLYTCIVHLDEL